MSSGKKSNYQRFFEAHKRGYTRLLLLGIEGVGRHSLGVRLAWDQYLPDGY